MGKFREWMPVKPDRRRHHGLSGDGSLDKTFLIGLRLIDGGQGTSVLELVMTRYAQSKPDSR
jgi:hypothetical protein